MRPWASRTPRLSVAGTDMARGVAAGVIPVGVGAGGVAAGVLASVGGGEQAGGVRVGDGVGIRSGIGPRPTTADGDPGGTAITVLVTTTRTDRSTSRLI
jgi:hypothetical protein